jgi:RNA polymerase sigma factor (sigma-70 family)
MAESEESWQRLIHGLRDGDGQIVQEFCEQYGEMLQRLADKHLAPGVRRRVGPEDVVQSACRTFLRRAKGGEFQLADSEALWRLLCAITLSKVREQTRFHLRQKRGLHREVEAALPSGDTSGADFQPVAPGPSPAEAAEFADQFQRVLAGLDEEERQVVDLKLQECTNDEIAERLGCSERTVRRLLKRVQAHLGRAFETR